MIRNFANKTFISGLDLVQPCHKVSIKKVFSILKIVRCISNVNVNVLFIFDAG